MDIQLYTLKPRSAPAIRWDGSAEVAQDIVVWIAKHSDAPVRSRLNLQAGLRGPGRELKSGVTSLEVESPVRLSISAGDYVVMDAYLGEFITLRENQLNERYEKAPSSSVEIEIEYQVRDELADNLIQTFSSVAALNEALAVWNESDTFDPHNFDRVVSYVPVNQEKI